MIIVIRSEDTIMSKLPSLNYKIYSIYSIYSIMKHKPTVPFDLTLFSKYEKLFLYSDKKEYSLHNF